MPKANAKYVALSAADREARDIERMQELNKWPRWPWLPLKRRKAGSSEMPELGLMHADHTLPQDGKPRVYELYLFQVGWFPAPEAKFTEYESHEAIVAAGWEID